MGKQCNVMAEVLGKRYRYMQERPMLTMFTTNLPDDKAMTTKYGERIATRIAEMCDNIVWKGPKEGFRKQTAPLLWTWPGSPQEAEVKERQTREQEARFAEMRRVEQVKQDERDRIEKERKEKEWQIEFALITKDIGVMKLDTLVMISQTHNDPRIKAYFRDEIKRRTPHPVEALHEFLNVPPAAEPEPSEEDILHPEQPMEPTEIVVPLSVPSDEQTDLRAAS